MATSKSSSFSSSSSSDTSFQNFTFDAIGRNPTQDEWCGEDVYKVYSVLDIDDRNAGVFLKGEEVDGRGWVDWEKIDEVYTPKIAKWLKIIDE